MSEKYDGVRGCWHPHRKTLYLCSNALNLPLITRYSRYAVEITALPESALLSFPNSIFLDGELWYFQLLNVLIINFQCRFGRSTFDELRELLSKRTESHHWTGGKFVVFDTPISSPSIPFEIRLAMLLKEVNDNPCIISIPAI